MENFLFSFSKVFLLLAVSVVLHIAPTYQNPHIIRTRETDDMELTLGGNGTSQEYHEMFSLSLSGAKAHISDCNPAEGMAFHHRTHQCHKLLTKGPCGELQLFYRSRVTPRLGRCTCVYNDEGCNSRRYSENSGLRRINRPVLMSPDRRRCFYAFTQGPCPDGQWYVLDSKKRTPVCQANPCKNPLGPVISEIEKTVKNKDNIFWFYYEGKCHQTFTKAYCQENEFVRFWGTDPRPSCVLVSNPRRSCIMRTSAATTVKCGMKGDADISECKPSEHAPIIFSQSTASVMTCDSGFRLAGRKCVPYGIFETGFEGVEITSPGLSEGNVSEGSGGGGPGGASDTGAVDGFAGRSDTVGDPTNTRVYVDLAKTGNSK